uniref:IU_nuc_hydro domain-containing protein n=1 Tax=Steinernema glaseri TaxID=37863 RepID=A0A1I7ZR67_9BILA
MDTSSAFGKDGIGDKPDAFPAATADDFSNFVPGKHAAQALVDLCREDKELTLVCLGPLTNVALALKLDPSFANMPKKVVIMGGNYYGIGNVASRPTVEFNFYGDPEAAHIVLAEMQCPIVAVPWEAFVLEGKKHEAEVDFEAHLNLDTNLSRFLKAATSVIRAHMAEKHRQFAYCDEIALSAAINPEKVIRQSRMLRVTVELAGRLTRGQVVVDWTHQPQGDEDDIAEDLDMSQRPVQFVTSYDVKEVDEMMIDAVKKI